MVEAVAPEEPAVEAAVAVECPRRGSQMVAAAAEEVKVAAEAGWVGLLGWFAAAAAPAASSASAAVAVAVAEVSLATGAVPATGPRTDRIRECCRIRR